jgi:hypothetical protein
LFALRPSGGPPIFFRPIGQTLDIVGGIAQMVRTPAYVRPLQ